MLFLSRDDNGDRVDPYAVAESFYKERIMSGGSFNSENSVSFEDQAHVKADELDDDAFAAILADLDPL